MKGNHLSLKEQIPSYNNQVQLQLLTLDNSLQALLKEKETSLDVILMRALKNLKSTIYSYGKLIEQILIVRGFLKLDPSRQRSLTSLLDIAKINLGFLGGSNVIGAYKFIQSLENRYLSNIENKLYLEQIKAVREEYLSLKVFIENH